MPESVQKPKCLRVHRLSPVPPTADIVGHRGHVRKLPNSGSYERRLLAFHRLAVSIFASLSSTLILTQSKRQTSPKLLQK